jgi:hypothetical protein
MARAIQPIFELGQKIRRLISWAIEETAAPRSEHAIAKAIGAHWSTFKSNLTAEKMSVDNQKKLAAVFGFELDWPEWRDPSVARATLREHRRDTAEAFLQRFLQHKSKGTCLTIEAGLTAKHIDRRFADFSLGVAGSFTPSSDSDEIPLVLKLTFDQSGWPVLFEETNDVLTLGLTEVDLQLFSDRPTAKIVALPISCQSRTEGNFQGKISGFPSWWRITVAAGDIPTLVGRRIPNDGRDCTCQGFQVGDKIRAVMSARVDKCFVSLAGEPFEGISDARTRFIKHLVKLNALAGAEAVLGEQFLTVVEHP